MTYRIKIGQVYKMEGTCTSWEIVDMELCNDPFHGNKPLCEVAVQRSVWLNGVAHKNDPYWLSAPKAVEFLTRMKLQD